MGDGELPFRYDVTLALVVVDALSKLPIPDFKLRVNNRKLAEGFYRGLGLTDTAAVLRSIDKLEKIGADAVAQELQREVGASEEQAQAALELAQIRTEDSSLRLRSVNSLSGTRLSMNFLIGVLPSLPKLLMRLPAVPPEKFLLISLSRAGWIITPVLSTRLCLWGMNR